VYTVDKTQISVQLQQNTKAIERTKLHFSVSLVISAKHGYIKITRILDMVMTSGTVAGSPGEGEGGRR